MATIVNNPTPVAEDRSGHTGLLIAVIVLLALAALFYFNGFRGTAGTANTGSDTGIERGVGGGGTNIQVPDQIDVNLNDQRNGQ